MEVKIDQIMIAFGIMEYWSTRDLTEIGLEIKPVLSVWNATDWNVHELNYHECTDQDWDKFWPVQKDQEGDYYDQRRKKMKCLDD